MERPAPESEPKTTLAVILDLDGTLLDSKTATKGVLEEFLSEYGKTLNQEIEKKKRFGFTQKQSAAYFVKDYDLPLSPDQFITQITPLYRRRWLHIKALPGANRLIKHLHKHQVPIALASNSLLENVYTKINRQQGWTDCFSVILGSDQVTSGKPSPDIFVEAASRLKVDRANCLVIEDSKVGVEAAKAAEIKVVAVPQRLEADCSSTADFVIHSLLEFQPELWGLPPFEDWVDGALPIDPLCLNCRYINGSLCEEETSQLPDQVSGVFFGWANHDSNIPTTFFKVVVSIARYHSTSPTNRKIQISLIDGENGFHFNQKLELELVGYIRGLTSKGASEMDPEIADKDKFIAAAAIELPMFIRPLPV